ncbi:hypothetical protein KAFR_0G01650 [Kazachstania africana CBS 2517]|uniref:Transcriptional regulatory protein RXT2 N-terminal domain-containing protein n=1 Tax=Kazachstania africana (strain ATCC 22294 / BCRC 22015 / CBS 2517 / CECT 1963 / NBRC 1671 / NRRL Y-8276) TaxID=1071382 RepID=H2AXU9_KAZAF|nr:hypothetical protein KAFR_0G01650 [Kazachstania africana CBS 2517]CCF59199.1 hypothetical protein KAFR_0G01650 [Kazachstania africana CBS 2517]
MTDSAPLRNGAHEEEPNELECIRNFTKRIIKQRAGNFRPLKRSNDGRIIFPSAVGMSSNRGTKLYQGSELISRETLNSKSLLEDVVFYNGSEHNLLQRFETSKKRNTENATTDNSSDDSDEEDYYDLHKLVNVRDLLVPIGSLSDIIKRPNINRPFVNPIIDKLSLQIILMIEKEQLSGNRYSRLLDIFLGDSPEPLLEKNLGLDNYDHNLKLPDEENDEDLTMEGEKDDAVDAEDDDPFFALPKMDKSTGLKKLMHDSIESSTATEQMEITRQMAQIALQRNQEFIRNLKKISLFLDKTMRIRERILSWSKEYVGIQDDDVTVPSALHVVKRGLISATTNKTMQDEEGNEILEE